MLKLWSVKFVGTRQWRIQDFQYGGAPTSYGLPTPDRATFRKICMSKRKNPDLRGGPAQGAPPGSATARDLFHTVFIKTKLEICRVTPCCFALSFDWFLLDPHSLFWYNNPRNKEHGPKSSGNFSIRLWRQYTPLFVSIAAFVSLLLTFNRKSSRWDPSKQSL